jgi:small GTP-binding protein
MINPAFVFEAGRMTVSAVKNAGGAVIRGGAVAHNWLKEKMPLEDPSQAPQGEINFPPLSVPVSESTGYKIKLLENTAKALGTPESVSLVRSIINQLNDESFKVLFVGHFNTGKSTLLNKLLERPLLKTGNGETTKTLAWLMYGEKNEEAAWYHDFQDDLHNITLDEIAEIPDEPPVFNVFACINSGILRHGVILIDTPGLEKSPETAALTNEAVENADAVILVVDLHAEQSDIKYIEKLKAKGKAEKLFVVVNKLDKAEAEEIPGIIKNRINMFSELGVRANIFPLSCKNDATVPDGFAKFRFFARFITP